MSHGLGRFLKGSLRCLPSAYPYPYPFSFAGAFFFGYLLVI